MKNIASFLRPFLAGFLLVCLLPLAQAQWSWKDKDGRRVFSDQPPPAGVPEKDILRRPAGARVPAEQATLQEASTTAAASATATTATAPKISGKDTELEKRKNEAKAREAAQKKAEAEKVAAERKDNCDRAKRAKASFDSGLRLATVNSRGEREIVSDAAKAVESQRLQGVIARDCN